MGRDERTQEVRCQVPSAYAPAGHKHETEFNCVQRAHQNTLENYPAVMLQTVITGLMYPKLAAAFGATWVLGRAVYGYGYATGNPSNRGPGGLISHLGDFPLIIL